MKFQWLDNLIKYAGGQKVNIPFRTIEAWMKRLGNNPLYLKELGLMQNLSNGPLESDYDKTPPGLAEYSPFKKIPDVRKFEIELSNYDVLYAAMGIRKRWSPTLHFTRYKNCSMNRYILNQKRRLVKCLDLGKTEEFFKISQFLIRHSKVFFISQLNHSQPNWHRKLRYLFVKKLYRNYKWLADKQAFNLDYKRVFIPKSERKNRPLGVPQPEWILYLGLWNRFFILFVERLKLINSEQHAYLPHKGTKTAWEKIFTKVISCQYIYSFDLEAFFPSVEHSFLYEVMLKKGFPQWVCKWVYDLNGNLPKGLYFTASEWKEIDQVSEPYKEDELARESLKKKLPPSLRSYYETEEDPYGELLSRSYDTGAALADRGVPQGGPISPLVSLLCLDEMFQYASFKTLMYADDGLFYSDNPEAEKEIESVINSPVRLNSGSRFSKEKSFWVKKGDWLTTLDFLGIRYDGIRGELSANTRKGSQLIYDKEGLIDLLRFREIYSTTSGSSRKKPSFENMIKLNIWGLIQSRLYGGKWNPDFEQDFSYSFVRGSWAHVKRKMIEIEELNVFNSTTFASKSLAYVLKHLRALKPKEVTKPLQEAAIVTNLLRNLVDKAKPIKWKVKPREWGW
jgi:retron-type reverse transcriptase